MKIEDRVAIYTKAFPRFPRLRLFNGRIEDLWFLGNSYGNKANLYGSYPNGYLKRMNILFPETKNAATTLHLFSGDLPPGPYTRFDIVPRAAGTDCIGDAHELRKYFAGSPGPRGYRPARRFQVIFADPPYSVEDANHYQTTMIKRNTVIEQCRLVLNKGGYLIWLDQVFPMFSKEKWNLVGTIGIVISTNHRFRCATILQKR